MHGRDKIIIIKCFTFRPTSTKPQASNIVLSNVRLQQRLTEVIIVVIIIIIIIIRVKLSQ